jgi:hypothetical protein
MESSARLPMVATRRTEFHTRVAAELWLNIAGKDFRLVGKTIRIGRSIENDIVIDDKSVSRYHALLTVTANKIILEDLKSRNGIRVNGASVRRAELKDNDQVRVGDLNGLFFQRAKVSAAKQAGAFVSKVSEISYDRLSPVLGKIRSHPVFEKFNRLEFKLKIAVVSGIALGLLMIGSLLTSHSKISVSPSLASNSGEQIVNLPLDRRSFEKCLELEDLGNFRQATACLKALPFTVDVQSSLERVKKQQDELSERRYEEGVRAFDNYYYDIAIQKWQEVLLISDDGSKYRFDAVRGIQSAEERKKLR